MSRYQKGKTNLDFTEARDSEWQWHQLGRMQVCTSLQTDNYADQFFTGRMPFLSPKNSVKAPTGQWFYVLLDTLQVISETFPQDNLLAWYNEKTKPNTTKARIHSTHTRTHAHI